MIIRKNILITALFWSSYFTITTHGLLCKDSSLNLRSNNNLEAHANTEFVIFNPSYNNEEYVIENLKSICHQNSTRPYHIISINDCSTDKTGQLMEEYVKQNQLESKVTVIHNKQRVGMVENIYNMVHKLPDDKVVIVVDGDDKLAHNDVILRLEEEYRDPDVWLTYGSSESFPVKNIPISERVPDSIFFKRKIRQYKWVTSHLRTFKAGLFKKINKKDLLYNETFINVTGDLAIMFPMLEMAGPKDEYSKIRSRYIKDKLHFYRMNNPLNDYTIHRPQQATLGKHIRALPPYDPIDSLLPAINTHDKTDPQRIVIASIPKSGTHLVAKIVELLTRKKLTWGERAITFSQNDLDKVDWDKSYFITHAPCIGLHPELAEKNKLKVICIVRDPRDVLISYAHWVNKNPHRNLMYPVWPELLNMPVPETISHFIKHFPCSGPNMPDNITITDLYKLYLPWQNYADVYMTTFENLVGPAGGGNAITQENELKALAQFLGKSLNNEQVKTLRAQLFGGTSTFREGRIGGWKENLTPQQKGEIKPVINGLLKELNYEKDENW